MQSIMTTAWFIALFTVAYLVGWFLVFILIVASIGIYISQKVAQNA